MPFLDYENGRVELDDKGYLRRFADWDHAVARALARDEGIEDLTAAHWRVLDYLRDHQQRHGAAPMIRVLCRETGFSLREIYDLFARGPTRGACRIAGLPRPDSCV